MAYTRKQCGLELKEKIEQKVDVVSIGRWAYNMYYEHMLEIDDDFQEFLKDLNAMEDDPQFELLYEELNYLADKLIAEEQWIDIYNAYNGQPKNQVRQLLLRQNLGKELKQRVQDREHVTAIGQWIDRYYQNLLNLDNNFLELLQKLSLMSVGFKNRRSYEELNQIADKLIAGEEVKLP
ncbi:hypothetical protein HYV10_01575 [Candidatus Dependentiae bacterium]|nr:hypothetical protein [Candidatus Dependentiae bacterium]